MREVATGSLRVHLNLPESFLCAEDDVEVSDLQPVVLDVLSEHHTQCAQLAVEFALTAHHLQVEAHLIRDVLVSPGPREDADPNGANIHTDAPEFDEERIFGLSRP